MLVRRKFPNVWMKIFLKKSLMVVRFDGKRCMILRKHDGVKSAQLTDPGILPTFSA